MIVLGIMVVCGVLFSPFYFIGRKKRNEAKSAATPNTMPRAKSALYLAIEAVLCIVFFGYMVVKSEMEMPAIVGWLATAGLVVAIWLETRRRK